VSFRSLIEINHDYVVRSQTDLLEALQRYLASGSREDAQELEFYGVKVIGMRHHSSRYIIESDADGFPPHYLPAPRQTVTTQEP